MRALAGAAGALLLGGCTLLGLSDGLEQAVGCGDCGELNFIETPPDCMSWRCSTPDDPDNGVCIVDLVDQDGDGAPLALCAYDERPADCDDQHAMSRPGELERCDARDNDCDEVFDEELTLRSASLGPALPGAGGLAWARDGEAPVLSYVVDGALEVLAGGARRPLGAAAPGSPTAIAAREGVLLVAHVDAACPAPRVAALDGDEVVLGPPLPTLSGACPDAPGRVDAIAIARAGDLALVVWVEGAGARDACGRAEAGEAAALLLARTDEGGFVARGTAPLALGAHLGEGAPALAYVAPLGFVVALAAPDSLRVVRVAEVGERLEAELLHRDETCNEACGYPSLSSAPVGDETALGLAHRAGPCAAPELRVRTFGIVDAALAPPEMLAVEPLRGALRGLALAGRASAPAWALARRDDDGLAVHRLGAATPLTAIRAPSADEGLDAIAIAYDAELTLLAIESASMAPVALSLACEAAP